MYQIKYDKLKYTDFKDSHGYTIAIGDVLSSTWNVLKRGAGKDVKHIIKEDGRFLTAENDVVRVELNNKEDWLLSKTIIGNVFLGSAKEPKNEKLKLRKEML